MFLTKEHAQLKGTSYVSLSLCISSISISIEQVKAARFLNTVQTTSRSDFYFIWNIVIKESRCEGRYPIQHVIFVKAHIEFMCL